MIKTKRLTIKKRKVKRKPLAYFVNGKKAGK
jgi:hypothetical protein